MTSTESPTGALARALQRVALNWRTIVELALVVAVAFVYQIENQTFLTVLALSATGFVVSILLHQRHRLPFFVLLSIAGILVVFGINDGAYLLAVGILLICIASLPIKFANRVVLLVAIGCILAAYRSGMGSTPWSGAIWPILGSMFMFRMILYIRAIEAKQVKPGIWNSLGYFFMLPNVAFPLFPVIDYRSFTTNYFDRDERQIYDQGMLWIARGFVHLVLYRLVYHYVLNDPLDVIQLSDLVQFMLGTFLLYLRVSGQFHIIVGLLHLFGFRLPETHKLYYLAHSFTELWRRINIYWTEFMTNAVFYPTYFKVKKMGQATAIALSTAMVFLVTWLLHSYQWFWLRGGFPIHIQDILFWGILGGLVVAGALRDLKSSSRPEDKSIRWNARSGLNAAVTFLFFCFLWSLWSSASFGQWVWMLSSAANVDAAGIALLLAVFVTILFLGGWNWERIQAAENSGGMAVRLQSARTFVPLVLLLLLATPPIESIVASSTNLDMRSLRTSRLNAQDAATQHRGYYEQLDIRQRLDAAADSPIEELRRNWVDPAAAGIIRERDDILSRDLYPAIDIEWNGNKFTTNEFGMRDKSYSMSKPERVFRIALLGPSHVMGNGVADDETFETLLENRLNSELDSHSFSRIEVLNFGVDGYALPQQHALLQDRVFEFEPDLIIATHYHQSRAMTEVYLRKVLERDAEVTDPDLISLLDSAGLEDIDFGKTPIPYQALRNLAKKLGVSPRMPHAELTGRIHRISNQANDWAIHAIASSAEQQQTELVLLILNEVLEVIPEGRPNQSAMTEAGVHVIDLQDVYADYEVDDVRVAPWDNHPNAKGHQVIADRLYQELAPFLTTLGENESYNDIPQ